VRSHSFNVSVYESPLANGRVGERGRASESTLRTRDNMMNTVAGISSPDHRSPLGNGVVFTIFDTRGERYSMGECPSRSTARLVLDVVGVQNVQVQKLRAHTMPSHVILILQAELSCLGTLFIAWELQALISGTQLGFYPSLRSLFFLTVAYRRVSSGTMATAYHVGFAFGMKVPEFIGYPRVPPRTVGYQL